MTFDQSNHQVDILRFFKPKFMQAGPKLSTLLEFRVVAIIFSIRKMTPFEKRVSQIHPFLNKTHFNLLENQIDNFILSSKMAYGKGIKPPTRLEKSAGHIFGTSNEIYLKKTHFGKSLHFNLLDDQVDTFSIILSPKFCMWERN